MSVALLLRNKQPEAKEIQLSQPSSTSLLMISSGLIWGSSSTSLLFISHGTLVLWCVKVAVFVYLPLNVPVYDPACSFLYFYSIWLTTKICASTFLHVHRYIRSSAYLFSLFLPFRHNMHSCTFNSSAGVRTHRSTRGHRLNTSIVLAAVHGLSGLFRAVSAVEPSLFRPLPPLSLI